MRAKKILILGASILQIPAITKAKEMGLTVGVVDFNSSAQGVRLADSFFEISTNDEQGVYHAAKSFQADGVMTMATDLPVRSVAYTCERMNLPGLPYEVALKASDKGEMRAVFRENNVPSPQFVICNGYEEICSNSFDIPYPLICKPVDSSGSRGVSIVKDKDQLMEAIHYALESAHCGRVILEEYMRGPEVSCEVIVFDGVPHFIQITDKLTSGEPYFVEIGHSQGTMLNAKQIENVKETVNKAISSLNINDSAVHAELILTEEGAKIVELGARLGGDWITSHLVPLSTGVGMVEATIKLALGEAPEIEPKISAGSAVRFLTATEGILSKIHGCEEALALPGVSEVKTWVQPGERVRDLRNSLDRIGCVISQSDNPVNALAICETALSKISLEVMKDIDK